MELAEFGALFERFERSAFRIEARDHYDVDDERERFAAFLEGRPALPRTPEDAAWLALVAASRAAGRVIERVRIVSEPAHRLLALRRRTGRLALLRRQMPFPRRPPTK